MGTSLIAPDQELPPGWEIARNRPHGLIEAVRRLSPTGIHVVVARDRTELIERIKATTEAGKAGL